jgi:hypothetical protein
MKRGIYLLGLLTWMIWGCSGNPADHANPSNAKNPASATPSASPAPDTASLGQRIRQLEAEMDSLMPSFEYRKQNLPVPSYYHKNWWSRYYIHGLALMAGVDSAGTFFLIDSYNCSVSRDDVETEKLHRGMVDCDTARSRLELRMKDTTVVLHLRPQLTEKLWPQRKPAIERDLWISTGYFCTDFYPLPDNPWLVALLAEEPAGSLVEGKEPLGNFRFYRYCNGRGKGDLGTTGKRDRIGIRDCARLSLCLKELAVLRNSIRQAAL